MTFIEIVKAELIKQQQEELSKIESEIQKNRNQIEKKQKELDDLESKIAEYKAKQEKLKLIKKSISNEEIESLSKIRNYLKKFPTIQKLTRILEELQQKVSDSTNYISRVGFAESNYIEIINCFAEIRDFFKELNKQIYNCKRDKMPYMEIEDIWEDDDPMKYLNVGGSFSNTCSTVFVLIKKCSNLINNVSQRKDIVIAQKRKLNSLIQEVEKLISQFRLEIEKYLQSYYDLNKMIESKDKIIRKYGINIFDLDFVESELDRFSEIRIKKEQEKLGKDIDKCTNLKKQAEDQKKENENRLTMLTEEKDKLEAEIKRIPNAQSLEELGFKDKAEAIKKLHIDTEDYIVVPIPQDIHNISGLFRNLEKQIKVEVGHNTFYTYYTIEEASGRINDTSHIKGADSALLIPIKDLKKEHINSIANGEIRLNRKVLQVSGIKALLPNGRKFNFNGLNNIEAHYYSKEETIEKYLTDSLVTDDLSESEIESILGYKTNVFNKEEEKINEAVLNCLFENFRDTKIDWEKIRVNGKEKRFNLKSQKNMQTRKDSEDVNEKTIRKICADIEYFLNNNKGWPKNTSILIDRFYRDLLNEYMRINKRARADYIEEQNTKVFINGRFISIKPLLPAKKEDVTKKYSRADEDIAYKIMKLAYLVNQFAHITEEEKDNPSELSESLFETKKKLIKRVIEFANNNDNIVVKKKHDDEINAISVSLEIPGYTEIALHVLYMKRDLQKAVSKLPERLEKDVIKGNSIILTQGVNRELLNEFLNNMNLEERANFCYELDKKDQKTLLKLIIRMGKSKSEYLECASEKAQKNFFREMLSDEHLNILMEMQEEER